MNSNESAMTPREVVAELDNHIIGQNKAKRAVAIALRNRWRRRQLSPELREEVTPKNILMIGPTGVGKTEIARRIARIVGAPFIKVDATKFTEVGYVGRDVESIIRDLVDTAFKNLCDQRIKDAKPRTQKIAERRIIDALLAKENLGSDQPAINKKRKRLEEQLRKGELDDLEISIDINNTPKINIDIVTPPGMEEITQQIQGVFSQMGNKIKTESKKITVKRALHILQEEEAAKEINTDHLKETAVDIAENNGIVFLDEIDKITRHGNIQGGDVSREGVQRDLLPLIEGCAVKTRHGMVRTDHILFITSGAFHMSKPSDLAPELQGRLPIRVELSALSADDFYRILVEPKVSLIKQYQALLQSEGLELKFKDDAIHEIANIAWRLNESTENIGARRLHTVMEYLLEELSYSATDIASHKKSVTIDKNYVKESLTQISNDEDMSRFIL